MHLTLQSGKVKAARGGPKTGKNRPGVAKRKARQSKSERIGRIADQVRAAWQKRMKGIDQHCLRMTHRTWALAAGVTEALIDRQLGHVSAGADEARKAAWSVIGRKHYTDMGSLDYAVGRGPYGTPIDSSKT